MWPPLTDLANPKVFSKPRRFGDSDKISGINLSVFTFLRFPSWPCDAEVPRARNRQMRGPINASAAGSGAVVLLAPLMLSV